MVFRASTADRFPSSDRVLVCLHAIDGANDSARTLNALAQFRRIPAVGEMHLNWCKRRGERGRVLIDQPKQVCQLLCFVSVLTNQAMQSRIQRRYVCHPIAIGLKQTFVTRHPIAALIDGIVMRQVIELLEDEGDTKCAIDFAVSPADLLQHYQRDGAIGENKQAD